MFVLDKQQHRAGDHSKSLSITEKEGRNRCYDQFIQTFQAFL